MSKPVNSDSNSGYTVEDFQIRSGDLFDTITKLQERVLVPSKNPIQTESQKQYLELVGKVRTYTFDTIGRDTINKFTDDDKLQFVQIATSQKKR